MADAWSIGRYTFTSRLLVGTGKFPDFATMRDAHLASGAEVVTVAVRRLPSQVLKASPEAAEVLRELATI